MIIAILHADAENYNDAMSSINIAIKKLPKKDKEYWATAPNKYAQKAYNRVDALREEAIAEFTYKEQAVQALLEMKNFASLTCFRII